MYNLESVYDFKKSINSLFPLIYDTKHIATECRKVIEFLTYNVKRNKFA